MSRDQRLWASSAAYQKGYRDGAADRRAATPTATVIRLHMEDGRVLITDAVIDQLRAHGFDIVPFQGGDA